ncbi:hypothetical protein [Nocardia sp. NPDC020380]|uniref:hypothetical protein n=1 Tax=Nocardia sp. NPDC020380 TaxID=3364309 RepID=UPI00379D1FF6
MMNTFVKIALTGSALSIAAATTLGHAGQAEAGPPPAGSCQWAGTAYSQGDTVYAGGTAFTCAQQAEWTRSPAAGHPDTVPSPGATQAAAVGFSAGAVQPGSTYFDTCEADTIQPGNAYLFQAVDVNGTLTWQADGPNPQWTYQPAQTRSCVDSNLN